MKDLCEIKELIRQIKDVNFVNQKALTRQQKIIGDEIQDISYRYFTEIKTEHPNYTINKNPLLKKFVIDEESDGAPDFQVMDYFKDNLEAFHELVSYRFCGKKWKKSFITENHIFHMKLFSSVCGKEYDLHFVNRKSMFFLLEEKITDILLIDYISNYFIGLADEIVEKLSNLPKQKSMVHEEMQLRLDEISEEINNKSKKNVYLLQNGAITFMDFLGWKGLWQNNDRNHLQTVSELIQNIEKKVQEFTHNLFAHSDDLELSKLISISDTIAIFTPKISDKNSEVELLELHAKIAQYILEECVERGYPIRGAIAFGEYNTKNSIMIGPGIDECASWHETCNWVGVHFTPSAELLIRSRKDQMQKYISLEANIPIKSGYPKVLYCVKWYVNRDKFMQLTRNAKALFPEISNKYMNTYGFLYGKDNDNGKDGIS